MYAETSGSRDLKIELVMSHERRSGSIHYQLLHLYYALAATTTLSQVPTATAFIALIPLYQNPRNGNLSQRGYFASLGVITIHYFSHFLQELSESALIAVGTQAKCCPFKRLIALEVGGEI
jgi:hypothetical protein